jgi:hypothetical protein
MSDLRVEKESIEFFDKIVATDFEDEDYGSFRITRLEGGQSQFSLDCLVAIDDEPDFHQSWRVEFQGVRRSTLFLGSIAHILVRDDHILLKEYFESEFRLGFRGKADKPALVVGELYRAHFEIAENWIPFNSYLNDLEVTRLIEEGFGTLAVGPKTFINLYDSILQRNGISTSVTDESTPKEWDGNVFKEFPKLTAFLFDDRCVVAEAVIVQRI